MTLHEFNLIQEGWMEGYKMNVENLRIQTWILFQTSKPITAKQLWPLPWDNDSKEKKQDIGELIRNNIELFDKTFPKYLDSNKCQDTQPLTSDSEPT